MSMDVELDGLFRQNNSFDYDEDYVYISEEEDRGASTAAGLFPVYTLVLIIGLLGNVLVLAVLAHRRRSWTKSDTFILHLSIADVLLLLMTLPFWAAQASQLCGWCFQGFFCKISAAGFNINFYCGIFLLVCISLDRYLSVVHSTQLYSQERPRLEHMSCLVIWIFSLLLSIPDWVFVVSKKHPTEEKTQCVHTYPQSTPDWLLVSRLLHHTLGFLLPAAVLVTCCSCTLLHVLRSTKGLQKQRSIMIILPLVVVFLLCWMPYNIALIVDTVRTKTTEENSSLSGNLHSSLEMSLRVTSALGCIHACLRPLLYLGLCVNFRKQALALQRCSTLESQGSFWELAVGGKAPTDQVFVREELEQFTSVDQQVQSSHCS
ncbi:uncharacterized protein V6R79_021840 [Siganus canaliculatus]